MSLLHSPYHHLYGHRRHHRQRRSQTESTASTITTSNVDLFLHPSAPGAATISESPIDTAPPPFEQGERTPIQRRSSFSSVRTESSIATQLPAYSEVEPSPAPYQQSSVPYQQQQNEIPAPAYTPPQSPLHSQPQSQSQSQTLFPRSSATLPSRPSAAAQARAQSISHPTPTSPTTSHSAYFGLIDEDGTPGRSRAQSYATPGSEFRDATPQIIDITRARNSNPALWHLQRNRDIRADIRQMVNPWQGKAWLNGPGPRRHK